MKKLAVALLLAAACSSSTSSVRVTVHAAAELGITGLEVKLGDKEAKTTSGDTMVVLVPDSWAGTSLSVDLWGLRDDNRVAHGRAQVTPILGEEVNVDINLLALPCGAWCTVGATSCVGDGVATCTQRPSDKCLEWGPTTACPAGTPQCSLGLCGATCIDECAVGDARCDGPGALRVCGQGDSDACNDWLPAVACAAGETCSNGKCRPACQDECSVGAKGCLGAGARTCADRDGDGCLEWGPVAPCALGETCSDGVCGHTACTDECNGTAKICDGNTLRSCGNYDLDTCKDLSAGVSCVPSDPCSEGTCTAGGCQVTTKGCNTPPASTCVDSNTLKVYDAVGMCTGSACTYAEHTMACANCPACDACAGVTCNTPPSPCFAATGTCSQGACTYAYKNGTACDDKDACTTSDTCSMGVCKGTAMVCDDAGTCSAGSCDATSGSCVQTPRNESLTCTALSGDPGTCASGTCNATPTCKPASSFLDTIYCDPGDLSIQKGNNAVANGGKSLIASYACAPSEAGPEIAYEFLHDSSAGDEDITVSLKLANPDGTVASSQTTVDLDLIILEGTCTGTAACANPGSGGVYQGVTTGTSVERVKFKALAGKTYYIVVDGKSTSQAHDFIVEVEACGVCQPTPTTRLDCNVSTLLSSSTASGAATLTNYMCTAAKTAVVSAGAEVPYWLEVPGTVSRNVTATLSSATMAAALKLLALPETIWGQCDTTQCVNFSDGSSGAATLTWATDPGSNGFVRYWVVVDAAGATNGSYGLQLACTPPCETQHSLACGGVPAETNLVTGGTTVGGPSLQNHYGPLPAGCDALIGLTGPETMIRFTPTITAAKTYELQLVSTTAGKNLSYTILDGGTNAALTCDPTLACVANTPQVAAGYSGTHTTGPSLTAVTRFMAQPGHTYFIPIDGTDASGATYNLKIVGIDAAAGCP